MEVDVGVQVFALAAPPSHRHLPMVIARERQLESMLT